MLKKQDIQKGTVASQTSQNDIPSFPLSVFSMSAVIASSWSMVVSTAPLFDLNHNIN